MTSAFLEMDLKMLGQVATSIGSAHIFHLEDEFVYIDGTNGINSNSTAFENDSNIAHIFGHHPVKTLCSYVIFCMSGEIGLKVNLRDYTLRDNDALIIQKGMIGEVSGELGFPCDVIVLAFNDSFFQWGSTVSAVMSIQQALYQSPWLHIPDEYLDEIHTLLRLVRAKLQDSSNPFRRESIQGLMSVFLFTSWNLLLKNKEKLSESVIQSKRGQILYEQFMDLLQHSYSKERNISYYADKLCVTPKYLSQAVKKASGRFAGEWISDYVVLEAKALLKSRRYTIQQISDILNFSQQSFFGRYFKQKVGLSPKEYRDSEA